MGRAADSWLAGSLHGVAKVMVLKGSVIMLNSLVRWFTNSIITRTDKMKSGKDWGYSDKTTEMRTFNACVFDVKEKRSWNTTPFKRAAIPWNPPSYAGKQIQMLWVKWLVKQMSIQMWIYAHISSSMCFFGFSSFKTDLTEYHLENFAFIVCITGVIFNCNAFFVLAMFDRKSG